MIILYYNIISNSNNLIFWLIISIFINEVAGRELIFPVSHFPHVSIGRRVAGSVRLA